MAANRKNARATMEISRRRPLRLALLASVSLLPMAGDLILATRAEASACSSPTISASCTGPYTTSGNTSLVTISVGASITGAATGISNGYSIGTLSNSGGIFSTGSYGIDNSATITSIENNTNATISGGYSGIYNDGSIGTLTNDGGITSSDDYAIDNDEGTFASIDNGSNATVSSSDEAVYNEDGSIGTLSNEGLITSTDDYGIENYDYGSITAITNGTGATISGSSGESAIYNYDNSSIGTLTNNGLITGEYGIDNEASLTSIDNGSTGTIQSTESAIYNDANIGTLTNSGQITVSSLKGIDNTDTINSIDNSGTSATISAHETAIFNSDTIGTLTNSGHISSTDNDGILNESSITSIDNTVGGTITAGNNGIENNDGSIGTLTNEGSIHGASYGVVNINNSSISVLFTSIDNTGNISAVTGVFNNGTITNLTNGGTITATSIGVLNTIHASSETIYAGDIATLTNTGNITGSVTGIVNAGGSIGTIGNSGMINGASSGTVGAGISNYIGAAVTPYPTTHLVYSSGTISTITNSGTITGVTGIYNDEIISLISNTGDIAGATFGIYNDDGGHIDQIFNTTGDGSIGTISAITNIGWIGLTYDAIVNEYGASIGTLTNSGSIVTDDLGIWNYDGGTIGELINDEDGTIIGSSGVQNYLATIGTLANNGQIYGTVAIGNTIGVINVLTIGAGGTVGAEYTGIVNVLDGSTIGQLTNDGLISGYFDTGIYNYEAGIGTLKNVGSIYGGERGITDYAGSIALLKNFGTITGGSTGILNEFSGSIGTLSDLGVITGSIAGIANEQNDDYYPAWISQLTIYGSVIGGNEGIYNSGVIETIYNTHEIAATNDIPNDYDGPPIAGIWNDNGSIGLLNNYTNGLITGAEFGIFNGGEIDTISNVFTITGTAGTGIGNYGYIGLLSNTGTLGDTGVIGGYSIGVVNSEEYSSIETLVNAGTIDGGSTGLLNVNAAYIGTLVNSGSILGDTAAIHQEGASIGLLDNSGTIAAYSYGIHNDFATIETLTNSGLIAGTSNVGVDNEDSSSIGTLTNSGTITGGNTGIYNFNGSTIDTLINTGDISGISHFGVLNSNYASIGTLINGGTITGENQGINDDSLDTIQSIDNSGLIRGTNTSGILDYGPIVQLTNSGTITGSVHAIYVYEDDATIGTLDNSGVLSSADSPLVLYEAGIGALINSGTITGGDDAAVFNYEYDTIGTLDNSGTILATEYDGIYNYDVSTIGGLTNSGLISGPWTGIYNDGSSTIGPVTNSGTITGGTDAIYNGNLITGITNSGVISATGASGSGRDGDAVVGLQNGYGGSIGVVSNLTGGSISGGSSGVYNLGLIETLSNAGVIAGGSTGVDNEGTIDKLSNSGTISGGSSGLDNEGGTIGTLINSGTITGTSGAGVYNSYERNNNTIIGTIDLLGNSGVITGGATGIYNANVIGAITNSGTISGGTGDGILNDTGGTIDIIQNFAGGKILGGADGINAGGGTVSISNAGVIKGVAGYGVVFNTGTLTNLAGATISGKTGVDITGNDAMVFDAGTIISTDGGNAIDVAPLADPAQIVLTTGSSITGTINGGGTDGQITLEGTGSLPNTIAGFTSGSSLTVVPGAKWTGSGSWTVATVTNNGTFEAGTLGTPLTLTGNYVQTAGGTLLVVVTPTVTSQFIVDGTASLEGTLDYAFAPGTYTDKTYSFITATGGISGAFSAANYMGSVPPVLLHATKGVTDAADLILSGTIVSNPKPIVIVTPEDDSIYADAGQAAAQAAQEANEGVVDYVTDEALTTDPGTGYGFADESASPFGNHYEAALLGAPASSYGATSNTGGACAAGASVPPPSGVNTTGSQMANAFAAGFCGAGGWMEGSFGASNVNGSGDASNYSTNSGGFLAGVDKVVNPTGTRLGLAVGYDETWLHDAASGKDSIDTTRVGLYGAQPLGRFVLAGDFMLGFANNTATRPTGVGPAHASYSGTDYGGGVQLATQLDYNGLTVRPAAGIRFATADSNGFSESGVHYVPAFAIRGASSTDTSVQPYVKVGFARSFLTPSAIAVTPSASIGYTVEAGDTGKSVTVTSVDGTQFASAHASLNSSAAEISLGLAAGKDNWSLYAHYTAYLAGNWTAQIGEAGLQVRF